MSSQFMVALCEIPMKLTLADLDGVRKRISLLSDERLNDIGTTQGWEDEDTEGEWFSYVRTRLLAAVDAVLDGFCEDSDNEPWPSLSDLVFGNSVRFIVTGGLSAGDDPSDLYTEVCILAEADVILPPAARVNAWKAAAESIERRNMDLNGLTRYTVAGYYRPTGERYASCFWAESPVHAEEQAINEAGPEMEVVAVILGQATVVA